MRHNSFLILLLAFIGTISLLGKVSEDKRVCKWLDNPVDDQTFNTFLDFFTYDKNLPFETQSIDIKEHEGVRRERLSFLSTSNERVFANLYSIIGTSSKKEPAVILLHGGIASGKDTPQMDVFAESLARAGWRILSIDLKYFGERSTGLFTTYTEEDKHEALYNKPSVYLSWVIQTVKDISRSIDFLVDQKNIDPDHISLIGGSRGGVVAAIAGGAESRLSAVVLWYGGHFDALEKAHLPAACPANYIGRISPRPLLMINGTLDADFFKETQVIPLYDLAKSSKEIIWVEGGHGFMSEEANTELMKWLMELAR